MKEDETRFDEAVSIVHNSYLKDKKVKSGENGGGKIRRIATVAIAKK